MCIHVYMHVCIFVNVYAYMCVHTHIYTCTYSTLQCKAVHVQGDASCQTIDVVTCLARISPCR